MKIFKILIGLLFLYGCKYTPTNCQKIDNIPEKQIQYGTDISLINCTECNGINDWPLNEMTILNNSVSFIFIPGYRSPDIIESIDSIIIGKKYRIMASGEIRYLKDNGEIKLVRITK